MRTMTIVLAMVAAWTGRPQTPNRSDSHADPNFTIVPGTRVGPVRANTTRADLPALFGGATIADGDVYIGEGLCAPGARVFAGTPDQIEIVWQDAGLSRVAFARLQKDGGRWATARGVRVGMLLTDLERIAGRALTFSGFGWDYGGSLEWPEGGGVIGIRMWIDEDYGSKLSSSDVEAISGDKPVRSDLAAVRRVRVRVHEILQAWGTHYGEHDCG